MLHGGSGNWQNLYPIIPDLSASFHIFAPDLRGHGKSGRVAWRYSLRDYAGDLAAFLREVTGPAFLLGHSLGGIIALMTAKQSPEYVQALILGDSPLDASTWRAALERTQERLHTWRSLSGGSIPVEQIIAVLKLKDDFLATRLYHQDPDVLGILLDDLENAAAGFEMAAVLPAIQCPVLLLQADPKAGGAMMDAEVSRALPSHHPTAQLPDAPPISAFRCRFPAAIRNSIIR